MDLRLFLSRAFSTHATTVSYLPIEPKTLGGEFKATSKHDFASGLKSPEMRYAEAVVIPFWFEEGDPTGTYKTEVFINGHNVKTVEYEVIPKRK